MTTTIDVKGRDLSSCSEDRRPDGTPTVHQLSPLNDRRWEHFLGRHPESSVFHSSEWLEALRRTYGYEPIAYTTAPPGSELRNGLLFCDVKSWLTGRRLVSVPFSDHCQPLLATQNDLRTFSSVIERQVHEGKMRYAELRPVHSVLDDASLGLRTSHEYFFHQIDLRPNLDMLYSNCHHSTRRNIRKAERAVLRYEEGRSEALLDTFFELFVLTRKRHQAPPQPREWFTNLIHSFREAIKIRVAYRDRQALAAILTLRYKDTMTFKYGCSDVGLNSYGSTHFLIWKTIEEAKCQGLSVLDLGRTDLDDEGLATFKHRFGSKCSMLTYLRASTISGSGEDHVAGSANWREQAARAIVSRMPMRIFAGLGSLMYRHIA